MKKLLDCKEKVDKTLFSLLRAAVLSSLIHRFFYLIHRLSPPSVTGSLLPHTQVLLPHSQALFSLIHRLSPSSYNGSLLPHTMAHSFLIQWLTSFSYNGSLLPQTMAHFFLIQ
jgi:hypothetical protein